VTFLTKIYILFLQAKDFVEIADILDTVTGSDSECDALSSGDELDDDGDEDWEMDNVQGGCRGDYDDGSGISGVEDGDDNGIVSGDGSDDNDDDNDDDNVPLTSRKKSELRYKLKSDDHLCHVRYPHLCQNPRDQCLMKEYLLSMSTCF
jgi:hypothetical protein